MDFPRTLGHALWVICNKCLISLCCPDPRDVPLAVRLLRWVDTGSDDTEPSPGSHVLIS